LERTVFNPTLAGPGPGHSVAVSLIGSYTSQLRHSASVIDPSTVQASTSTSLTALPPIARLALADPAGAPGLPKWEPP
jgi:hypothetical protein